VIFGFGFGLATSWRCVILPWPPYFRFRAHSELSMAGPGLKVMMEDGRCLACEPESQCQAGLMMQT
jgi:hypothetical protein